jgi:hypothetical protein
MRVILVRTGIVVLLALVFPLLGGLAIAYGEWSGNSDRRYHFYGSSGQAPSAQEHGAAIVQVYAARAARWRGIFGVHTWIAYKKTGATQYVRTEVIGWGARYKESVVVTRNGIPDQYWYGYEPELLADIRGQQAEKAIARIESLIEEYPFRNHYQIWPGPNSNTYTAHLIRQVEELVVDLPATAIGKDYTDRVGFAAAPSNTGYQFLAHGLFGVKLALEEGLEINILGATYGLDLNPLALKLPCIGRLGF